MAGVNKSGSHSRAFSASSIPSSSLPYVSQRSSMSKSKGRKSLSSAMNITKSLDFSTVESEYIRNLQQQIYFLELENDYLRDQTSKVVELPASVTIEAEKMMGKIKVMRRELQSREDDLVKKESAINILQHDKQSTMSRLELVEESYSTEKRELINDIVQLKKKNERYEIDLKHKENDLSTVNDDLENTLLNSKEADQKVHKLQQELTSKTNECNQLKIAYEDKRNECIKSEAEFRELEERFFRSKITTHEESEKELRVEMKRLRYDLREKELQSQQDRTLRIKISDDCAALVKENAGLSSQVIELQKNLDAEQQYQEDQSTRKQTNIQELVTLKENRQHYQRELENLKEELEIEQNKYRKLLDKFVNEEENHTRAELSRCKLKANLEEVEGRESLESRDNVELRRDNVMLTDKINNLQRKLRDVTDNYDLLQSRHSELEGEFNNTQSKLRLEANYDRIKWEEFDRMTKHMNEFSKSMSPIRKSISNTSVRSRVVETDE